MLPWRSARVRRALQALVLALLPGLVAAPFHAAAEDDPYSATVTVDATSDTVAKARDVARVGGARKALDAIIERVAGSAGNAKPVKLSDNQIVDMVASFEVANEKMTAVRYTADYTYHFRPDSLKRALQSAGIAMGEGNSGAAVVSPNGGAAAGAAGKPVLVLPVYQQGADATLWEEPNPWRQAWAQRPGGGAGANLMVPLGDAGDVSAIDADKARSGDPAALAAIAQAEGADDVLVMLATQRGGSPAGGKAGLDIVVRRYRAGKLLDMHADTIDAKPGEAEADFFRRAADTIAADIDNGWKNAKDNLAGQQGSLVVAAPVDSLDDWLKLRERLASLPSVRKIDVKSLSRQEVSLEIQYQGTLDQLRANLASVKLDLEGGDPAWRLARTR